MASMTNIGVELAPNVTYTWAAMTPGSVSEPARWRGSSLAPTNVTSRTALPALSFKYHRNTANTADRTVVSGYVPIVCTGDACYPTEVGKVPFNFSLVLPDQLDDTQRSAIVNVITKTFTNTNIVSAIVNGEGFY